MSKARSGGGIRSNKVARVGVRAGSRTTNVVSPSAVADLGGSLAYKRLPLVKAQAPAVPMGNDLARNVGTGGPGAGRVTHHCGTQGTHGNTTGTNSGGRPARDILGEFGPEKSRG
jgi:hypothetical protein